LDTELIMSCVCTDREQQSYYKDLHVKPPGLLLT